MTAFFVADVFDLIVEIVQLVCKADQASMALEVSCSNSGLGIFHQTELNESPTEDSETETLVSSNNSSCTGVDQLNHEILQTNIMGDLAPALDKNIQENGLMKGIEEMSLEEVNGMLEITSEEENKGLVNGIEEMTTEEVNGILEITSEEENNGLVNGIDKMNIEAAPEDDNIAKVVLVNGHATAQDVTDAGPDQSMNEFNINGKRRQSVADLKNMFESFREDPGVDDDLEDKLDRTHKTHNGDFVLDQKFDAFFESVNGCKDDNLDENNPINSFVLKTPSKSQPPNVENESPIKLVLDMITPPPDADLDEEAGDLQNKAEKGKSKPSFTKSAKGKPATPARKKIGVDSKGAGGQKRPDTNQPTKKPSQTKETVAAEEKPKSPSKRPPGIGYDGRPLMVVKLKKTSTPTMSSGTAKPVAAPRRNSMPSTTKQTPTSSFMPATSKPMPTSRKQSGQNNTENTPKKSVTNPSTPKKTSLNSSTPKKTSLNSSTPKKTAPKPSSVSKPATSTTKTSRPTSSTDKASIATKPTSSVSKSTTSTSKPTTAKLAAPASKSSTATTKPSTAVTKPNTATNKPKTEATKPISTATKQNPTVKQTSTATKPVDNKSTVKHKGVPFLPKKVTSSAPSTAKSSPTTNSTTSSQSSSKSTKPANNQTKSTKPTATGGKEMGNGSKPTSTSKSSTNIITITNGRTIGKKASITDEKSEADAIAKHIIKKKSITKSGIKKGGHENKVYSIARDLIMDIVAKSI